MIEGRILPIVHTACVLIPIIITVLNPNLKSHETLILESLRNN